MLYVIYSFVISKSRAVVTEIAALHSQAFLCELCVLCGKSRDPDCSLPQGFPGLWIIAGAGGAKSCRASRRNLPGEKRKPASHGEGGLERMLTALRVRSAIGGRRLESGRTPRPLPLPLVGCRSQGGRTIRSDY